MKHQHTISDLNISMSHKQHVVLYKKSNRGGEMRINNEVIKQLEERVKLLEETNNDAIGNMASYIWGMMPEKLKKIGEHTARGVVIGLSIELAVLTFLVAAAIAGVIYEACVDGKY